MQYSFDPLTYEDQAGCDTEQAKKMALSDRNKELKRIKRDDPSAFGWALPGQLRKYSGFGQPDGRVRTVYYITTRG